MKAIRQYIRFGISALLVILAMQFSETATARDTARHFSIAEAMETDIAKSLTEVEFYFGDQPHSDIKRSIGIYTTKRTSNAFSKADYDACQWAFLSAIKTLHERAVLEGGNAVINIQSVTTGKPVSSSTDFVCRAGFTVAKVYLKGELVSL